MTDAQHRALSSYILAAGGALLAALPYLPHFPPWLGGACLFVGAVYRGWRDQTTAANVPAGDATSHAQPAVRDLRTQIPQGHFHAENANSAGKRTPADEDLPPQ